MPCDCPNPESRCARASRDYQLAMMDGMTGLCVCADAGADCGCPLAAYAPAGHSLSPDAIAMTAAIAVNNRAARRRLESETP